MNKLEFRAWHKKNKKYYKVNGIDFNNKYVFCDGEDKIYNEVFRLDEVIIYQYTGLQDKNGKKIYGGDRLSMTDEAGKNGIVTVGFEEGGFIVFKGLAWRYIGTYDKLKNNIEVVGNIHENPELLGKEKQL